MDRQISIVEAEVNAETDAGSSETPPPRRRRPAKAMTEDRLYQAALYYLGRYAASSASVRRVLGRRVTKYAAIDGVELETARRWIDSIVERLTRAGILDDGGYAAGRARSMFERGLSLRMIKVKLAEKGLERGVVEQAIDSLSEEHRDPDLAAARRLARRRRLGPFREEARRASHRNRDLAAMARAGFSFDIARLVIEAETVDTLEDLDRGR